jgi:predicted transposase/invertase (TIGR01784 family)
MVHPIIFSPEDDIIDICRDNVFKTAFTRDTPESQGALRCLVSALVGQPVSVLSVMANEPPVTGDQDRQIRYDLRVRFNEGRFANIEITLNPRDFEPLRMEYYGARLYVTQNIKGSRRNFGDLTHTYQISIIRGKRIFKDEAPVHQFEYYDREHGVSLDGRTRIIVVELEKAEALLGKAVEAMSSVERWIVFFRYVTDPEKRDLINKILAYEEGITMVGEVLLTISRDEEERARLESEFKYELDRQCEMEDARRAGLAEGELIGLEKGELIGLEKGLALLVEERREIARRLKAMGISPEEILPDFSSPARED